MDTVEGGVVVQMPKVAYLDHNLWKDLLHFELGAFIQSRH